MEESGQILDNLYDSTTTDERQCSLDENSIADDKKDDIFSLESISDKWRDTSPRNVKMFIETPKLKTKEFQSVKNAIEIEKDADSQMSLIRNFSLDSEEDNDFNTELPLTLIDAQQVLYIGGCKRKNVIPIRMVKELTEFTQTLNVSYSNLGVHGAKALAIPLHLNSTITSLNLEDNDIGPDGCQCISEVLLENRAVTDLNLSRNNIGLHGLICICRVLKTNLSISRLNLSGNGFGDESSQLLAFLLQHTSLKELDLSANELDYKAAKTIGDHLGNNETLEVFDLSRNHFRNHGAVAIAKGVKENTSLRKLDISYNGFASEGVVSMAAALASNKTLEELDMSSNRITDEVIPMLCTSLNVNGSLLHLKIGENLLTMPAAMAFLTMVNTSTTSQLVSLDLKGVFIEHEFFNLLKEIQKTKSFIITPGSVCYMNLINPHKAVSQS